jgi:hypothetical protein
MRTTCPLSSKVISTFFEGDICPILHISKNTATVGQKLIR